MKKKFMIFDAYGTLLDINSPVKNFLKANKNNKLLKKWDTLCNVWREKQISYTWLLNITNSYYDFFTITKNSLNYALNYVDINLDEKTYRQLLNFYLNINPYSEVENVLNELKSFNYYNVILTNGNYFMIEQAIKNAKLESLIDNIISVEEIRLFKPDPRVYKFACEKLDCSSKDILFFSSNSWDIYGALNYGFDSVWINRTSFPIENLPLKPEKIITNLNEIFKYL